VVFFYIFHQQNDRLPVGFLFDTMQVYANRRLLTFYIMKETIEPNASEENEPQEINPSIWKQKISEDLEKLKMMEHPTKEKIANMALEDGILARIAPEDDRVREKRKEDGRRLWEGERMIRNCISESHMRFSDQSGRYKKITR